MLAAAHPSSPRGRLEAIDFIFGPSDRPRCLHLTRHGRPVGHLDAGEIAALDEALVSGQHDAHCRNHRRLVTEAALVALAAVVDAAEARR